MIRVRRALVVATLGLGLTMEGVAKGGGDPAPPPITLTLEGCQDLLEAEVQRIVGVELGAPLGATATTGGLTTRITARCEGTTITLTVDDAITRKSLRRVVSLDAIPMAARPRLLALSIAELLSVSWSELDSDTPPPIEPEGQRAPIAVLDAARAVTRERAQKASPPRFTIATFAGAELFAAHPIALWNLGVHLGWDSTSAVSLGLDVTGGHGSVAAPLGAISLDTWSASGALLYRRAWSPLTLRVGGGIRAGVARIIGHPTAPDVTLGHTITGFWGGPVVCGSLEYTPQAPLRLGLTAGAGYAAIPVHALLSGEPVLGASGVFLGATLSAGVLF